MNPDPEVTLVGSPAPPLTPFWEQQYLTAARAGLTRANIGVPGCPPNRRGSPNSPDAI